MKKCLLLLAVVGLMMVSAPAYSQYVFIDVNGDGLNSVNPATPSTVPDDVLTASTTSVDVYFVTNGNRDGSLATCIWSPNPFDINSYELILHSTGTGSVLYGTWHDNTGFPTAPIRCGNGTQCPVPGTPSSDVWIGKFDLAYKPEGKYKVGTLDITVTGSVKLDFASTTTLDPVAATQFGSSCRGSMDNNTIALGQDFFGNDGTESPTPVKATTWGKIKSLYK